MEYKNYDEFKTHFAHHFHFKDEELDGDKDNAIKYFYETYCKDAVKVGLCDPANEAYADASDGFCYVLEFFMDKDGTVCMWTIVKVVPLTEFTNKYETVKKWFKFTFDD